MMASYKEQALPSKHSISVCLAVLAICCSLIPNLLNTIDDVATVDKLTTPVFEGLMSRSTLGWLRLLIAISMSLVTIWRINFQRYIPIKATYLSGSRLKSAQIELRGLRTQYMFTSWAWNMLTFSFAINGTLTLLAAYYGYGQNDGDEKSNNDSGKGWIPRFALLLFEISASTSGLVAAATRYVLWPHALRNGAGTTGLKKITSLLQHNANVILSLIEVGLLGGVTVRMVDICLAPLFGLTYVLFLFFVRKTWVVVGVPAAEGYSSCKAVSGDPHFPYFFMDPTLGVRSTQFLLALVAVLVASYSSFAVAAGSFLGDSGNSDGWDQVLWRSSIVLVMSSFVCRFRD